MIGTSHKSRGLYHLENSKMAPSPFSFLNWIFIIG